MSDIPDAGGDVAGEQDDSVQTQPTQDSGQGIGLGALRDDAGDASGDAGSNGGAPEYSWPDNWREGLTGGDAAAMKIADRFGSPQAMFQKLLAQEQVIRRGAHKALPTLPDNPTEDQVAEYRKALNIPEKPDGYGIEFSKDLQVDDSSKAAAKAFAEHMHSQNVPAQYAKQAFDFYQQWAAQTQQEMAANLQREFARTKNELKGEYGKEYLRNAKLLEEFLEERPELSQLVQQNIHRKGVLKEAIELALSLASEDALYTGDSDEGGKPLEQEIDELSTKSIKGQLTPAEDQRYMKLLGAKLERDARAERRRGRAA